MPDIGEMRVVIVERMRKRAVGERRRPCRDFWRQAEDGRLRRAGLLRDEGAHHPATGSSSPASDTAHQSINDSVATPSALSGIARLLSVAKSAIRAVIEGAITIVFLRQPARRQSDGPRLWIEARSNPPRR